jgi:oligoribonuclease NrnB/cAMP/cGMP phosphodiesterase (DHH superfamily)
MKPLVIYHADCTDGYGAAFAAWLKLGDEAEYMPMNYNSINPADLADLTDDREVYILDFSFERQIMDFIFRDAKRVVWLDHHKTAFEMWCAPHLKETTFFMNQGDVEVGQKDHYILLDNNKSGAMLAWEYFHPGTEVPMLIQHIDDRDRWQWKLDGSAEIHAALGSMKPWSFEQWMQFVPYFDDTRPYIDLKTEGTAILRAQKQHVEQMAKQARECNISIHVKGKKVRKALKTFSISPDPVFHGLAVNASLHQSEVGHELANASGTFGLVWYVAADCRVRCSLRSNGDYDVSSIARSFGGGGHRNAAGFETDIETLMGWLHA